MPFSKSLPLLATPASSMFVPRRCGSQRRREAGSGHTPCRGSAVGPECVHRSELGMAARPRQIAERPKQAGLRGSPRKGNSACIDGPPARSPGPLQMARGTRRGPSRP
jgi:hypothetical protein